MDGTRADRLIDGHFDRPASMEIILRDYPDIIVGLISGRSSVSIGSGPDGARNFKIFPRLASNIETFYTIREEDFEICKQVAILFTQDSNPGRVSAFLSEPIQDLRKRIGARLSVAFIGR